MRRLSALAAFVVVLAPAVLAQAPAPGDVVINEILYDPPTGGSANEWIEVVNRSAGPVDLAGLVVTDNAGGSQPVAGPLVVPAGGFAVFVRDAAAFAATYPGVAFTAVTSFPSLNNDGDRVGIAIGGTELDAVDYDAFGISSNPNRSLERRSPDAPSGTAASFDFSTDPSGATPGAQNSIVVVDTQGPTLVSGTVSADGQTLTLTVDEPLDPASVTAGAFTVSGGPTVTAAAYDGATTVTLTLSGPLPAGASTVTASGLRDLAGNTTPTTQTTVTYAPDVTPPALASATPVDATTVDVTFSEALDPASVQPGDFQIDGGIGTPASVTVTGATVRLVLSVPLQNATGYALTVTNVADTAGNVLASAQTTFFFGTVAPAGARDVVINEIMYDPPAPQPASNEWIEVVNRSGRAVDLGGMTISDGGTPSGAVPSPFVLQPGAYAVFVSNGTAFAAAYPGVAFTALSSFPTLNNTGDRVALLLNGVELDAVPYTGSWGGMDASLERKDPNGPSTSAVNFATSTDPLRGTPGRQNSQFMPDVQGPRLVAAVASPDGRTVVVTLDEPAAPASVTAGAFTVSGGMTVTDVAYDGNLTVTLTLSAALPAGASTVSAAGLTDLLGNVTPTTQTSVTFTVDATPPTLARAFAQTPTTVRVVFSEPVTVASASDAAAYAIDGSVGTPTDVVVETGPSGGATAVTLTLGTALAERQVYTLTVSGLTDLAGNTTPAATAVLFFGQADTPARGELVINEILYDPLVGSDGEYIELLNTTADKIFDLGAVLIDGDLASRDPAPVLPGQYGVVARNGAAFATAFPGVPFVVDTGLSLSNSGDTIVIEAGGAVIDSVAYDPDWHRPELDDATGISLERRDPLGPSNAASNWSSSLDPSGGTPGRANSVSVADNPQPRDGGLTVTSPFAPDEGQAARITYTLEAPAGLVRVRIFDGGGRLVREVEDGRLSGSTGEVIWDGRGSSGERLRAGIYVLLLEAVDVAGGTSEAHRGVVVLARR